MKKLFVMLVSVLLLMLCPVVYADVVVLTETSAGASLTQNAAPTDPGAFRGFGETVIVSIPSSVPYFGPVAPSWTSSLEFGGKTEFTMAELKNFLKTMGRPGKGTENCLDLWEDVKYSYDRIKLLIPEPIQKDGKLFAPRVSLNGDSIVRGNADVIVTKKNVPLRKAIIENMIDAMKKGCNLYIIYNHGDDYETQAWSLGYGGGAAGAALYGNKNETGAHGTVSGGTYIARSRLRPFPWANGIVAEVKGIPKVSKNTVDDPRDYLSRR